MITTRFPGKNLNEDEIDFWQLRQHISVVLKLTEGPQ